MTGFSQAALALVLVTPLVASAQARVPRESARQPGVQVKGVDLSGKVSKDGKMLLADDDNIWSVSNFSVLKGLEGHYATVKCQMDLGKRAIHVLYIIEPGLKHAANWEDSAFRR